MTFIYDPQRQSCHDPDTGVTAHWNGGGGFDELTHRFRFTHPDWEYCPGFFIEERDISRKVVMGDLTKNEVLVETTYGPDPVAIFGPGMPGSGKSSGALPDGPSMRRILHEGIECLYSRGGREPIRIAGILMLSEQRKQP